MKARTGLAVIALLLVALVLWRASERTSPGDLSEVHAQAKLASSERCEDCHPAGSRTMADACTSCHADVGASIAAGRGLHGRLGATAAECSRCHVEHLGRGLQLVDDAAFTRAGYASSGAYRHEGLDFRLAGAHAALACDRCHALAQTRVLPQDGRRFLGLTQSCTSCHKDPHEGRYGADCASCHGQSRDFKSMDGLDHDRFCPLVGSHAKLDCKACHRVGSAFAVDALVEHHGDADAPARRDCLACHVSPHRQAFVAGFVALASASLDVATAGTSCKSCHSAAHESFEGETPQEKGWHAATGFPLEAPHAGLRCESCHPGLGQRPPMASTFPDDGPRPTPDSSDFLKDFPGRQADDCRACHSDPHAGQFATGPFHESSCLDCHDRHAFAPANFDVAAHAKTGFPLLGKHASTACATCHRLPADAPDTPEGRATRRFAGVPTSCSACHASPHRESFLDGVATQLGLSGGDATCAHCHAPEDADFRVRHDDAMGRLHAMTGFPLDPPHADVSCVGCHKGLGPPLIAAERATPQARLVSLAKLGPAPPPVPLASSSAFGAAFPGRLPDDCRACHEDAHRGQFDSGPFAGQGCLACHARHAFKPVLFDDTQHAHTAFPLTGAHLATGCNECHLRPGESRRAPARPGGPAQPGAPPAPRIFAGTPSDCAACHADVHAGRFDGAAQPASVDGRAGCARCHSTSAWDDVPTADFDHARWTGYALDGAHARTSCVACHVPGRGAASGGRVFGVAAGTGCSDCHADAHAGAFDGPDRPASVGGASSCARCHSNESFTDVPAARFDHASWTGYALEGAHARTQCVACHVPRAQPDANGRSFGRAAGRGCSDCHAPGSVRADGKEGGAR